MSAASVSDNAGGIRLLSQMSAALAHWPIAANERAPLSTAPHAVNSTLTNG
ncbi:hypothetical protein ACWCQZ_51495 [Streptomyces sp. NPDC002285]